MKQSNYIVLGSIVLVSMFLLWLWWYLGFAKVDAPTDIFISIAWWLVIALVGYGIHRMEGRRREQMRTIYVSPTALFNCESGLVECRNIGQRVALVEEILKSMRYGMDFQDMPDPAEFAYSYIIRTKDYKDASNWKGTVVKVDRSNPAASMEKKFTSRDDLAAAFA